MKKRLFLFALTILLTHSLPFESMAQRRRVIVRPRPVHTRLVVRTGHPLRRRLPSTVVVRSARKPVVVNTPLVFSPALTWTPAVVMLPARERLKWQDSEVIESDEGWVDTNFGIDESGNALFLEIDGKAELNFAEVTFANGNVQVVDLGEQTHGNGIYKLLDFADGRHVKTVRLLALSKSEETKLVVYLSA
jgi:hypothetical protein